MALQERVENGQLVQFWKPFKTQEDFIKIPDTVEERFFGGMVGGGKTDILIYMPVVRGWYQNKNFRGLLIRRTYKQLEKSIIPRANEIYKKLGAIYNINEKKWSFPSGAIIWCTYLENRKDAESHDTNEYHYIGIDELTHFEEFLYMYMMSRLRSTDPTLPAILASASNPGNIGHGWVKKRFIDPEIEGHVIIHDLRTDTKRMYIPSSIRDNTYLMDNDPGYLNRLENLPEAERRAKIYGDWEAFTGQVFDEFIPMPDPFDKTRPYHVCKPFVIPPYWPKFVSIDWGHQHPTAILWAALSPDGRLYIYREFLKHKLKVSVWANEFALLSETDGAFKFVKMDPSAWQERGTENTIQQEFCKYSGYTVSKADNDRLGGKMLIHEYLRTKPLPARKVDTSLFSVEHAQRILRTSGEAAYNTYMDLFLERPEETNLPKLQIFETCTGIIQTLPLCVYDTDAHGKKAEDVKKWDAQEDSQGELSMGDDLYDDLRYLLKGVDKYIEESKDGQNTAIKEAQIYEKLQRDGNHTAFQRSMELFDKEQESQSGVFRLARSKYQVRRPRY